MVKVSGFLQVLLDLVRILKSVPSLIYDKVKKM
jgi:hypothetical protein